MLALTFSEARGEEKKYQYHIQSGFEWDSNIFKTFNQTKDGFLYRALIHHDIELAHKKKFHAKIKYNVGGKIFLNAFAQNLMIHGLDIPLAWKLKNEKSFYLKTSIKYQNENNTIDNQGLDLNEDYFSFNQHTGLDLFKSDLHNLLLGAYWGYFHFFPRSSFGFFSQRIYLNHRIVLHPKISSSIGYSLTLEQFNNSTRHDHTHIWSVDLNVDFIPYLRLKYHYELNGSSNSIFNSDGHRVDFVLSHLFRAKDSGTSPKVEKGLFSIHVLATVLLKNFPSVSSETLEGERFLITGAEDQNFNHLTLKASYHIHPQWAIEGKYSRFSNALSSQNISFSRNLIYLGIRAKM